MLPLRYFLEKRLCKVDVVKVSAIQLYFKLCNVRYVRWFYHEDAHTSKSKGVGYLGCLVSIRSAPWLLEFYTLCRNTFKNAPGSIIFKICAGRLSFPRVCGRLGRASQCWIRR